MTIYSTRPDFPWTMSAHSLDRLRERRIGLPLIQAVLRHARMAYPSPVSGSGCRVLTGRNGVTLVVDPTEKVVVTAYRGSHR